MKLTLNMVALFAALAGIFSFSFLIAAISTDFWYLIDASKLEKMSNHTESMSSHSGLWRTCQLKSNCLPIANPFKHGTENITASHQQLLNMHGAFVILLPLSLVVMTFGGMTGFIATLAQVYLLLIFTGLFFLFGALLTLTGLSIYVAYSAAAFKEVSYLLREKNLLEHINIQFGWSLAFAWFSFATEVLTGLAFLLMSRMVGRQLRENSSI
ncbi:transmembrane protein 114 [Anolis sagrei]|uniref:transmembrane protein 114 n=1 Tax=Anolis sagrei TaxID=38937 RepID=UPI003521D0C8